MNEHAQKMKEKGLIIRGTLKWAKRRVTEIIDQWDGKNPDELKKQMRSALQEVNYYRNSNKEVTSQNAQA
jgi:hypothetical protein